MRALVTVVALGASTASAAPLGIAWRRPACAHDPLLASGRDLLLPTGRTIEAIDRASGASRTLVDLPAVIQNGASVAHVTADTVIVRDKTNLFAFDVTSGAMRWPEVRTLDGQPVAFHTIPSRLLAFDGDGIVGFDRQVVRLVDVKGGTAVWRHELQIASPIAWLGIGTSHVFALVHEPDAPRKSSLIAVSRTDGTPAWSVGLDDWPTPQVAGDNIVIATKGVEIIDGATGAAAKLALRGDRLAVRGDRAYTIEPGPAVAAIDVPNQKLVWTAPLAGSHAELAGATATSIVVVEDREMLRVLDAGTGAVTASYGVAADPDVAVFDGAPLIVACDGTDTIALDPSAKAAPEELATISGRIRCSNCAATKLPISAGGVTGTTDVTGRFSLRVHARGTLAVRVTTSSGYGAQTVARVTLAGTKRYELGTIDAQAWDGE
jgi:hypothetical protein